MGAFYGSTHIHINSAEKVKDVLEKLCVKEEFKCYLSPHINGWVGVFNDMNGQVPLAETLAEHFKEDVISFLVHDDSVFCYWYYKGGQLLDNYNSCPDYFGEVEDDAGGGNPEAFKRLLGDKGKIKRIKKILGVEEIPQKPAPPRSVKKEMGKMMKINQLFDKIAVDPMELLKFAQENDIPLEDKMGEKVKNLMQSGMTLEQAQTHIAKDPTILQDVYLPMIERIVKKIQGEPDGSSANETDEISDGKRSSYLFAGEQLRDFAEVLGIVNVLTCYEYLEQGETDTIESWERFVRIP